MNLSSRENQCRFLKKTQTFFFQELWSPKAKPIWKYPQQGLIQSLERLRKEFQASKQTKLPLRKSLPLTPACGQHRSSCHSRRASCSRDYRFGNWGKPDGKEKSNCEENAIR